MYQRLWRILSTLLCLCLLLPMGGQAAEAPRMAEDISGMSLVTASTGFDELSHLFDRNHRFGFYSAEKSSLTLEYAGGMGSLYIQFGEINGPWTITDNASGKTITCGTLDLLHEFIDLEAEFGGAPTSITLNFEGKIGWIFEISVFTTGEVPDTVQKWVMPEEGNTDLLLFTAHGDDEQLYFAGLLPYYAVERDYQVQVVYLSDHRNRTSTRMHEMLNGLWAVGIRTYPIFGPFPDFLTLSKSEGYDTYRAMGYTKEDIQSYVVEQLRRFKPMVTVGHDFAGEYGNSQHQIYAEVVAEALELAEDPEQFPESARQYGTWEVPKAYFHLYEENPIRMDWDTPMESFNGMTPFEVTRDLGWPCHISQIGGYNAWIHSGETAAEIPEYSPCDYGLYRSLVGPDVEKKDFFENLSTYSDPPPVEETQPPETEPPVTQAPPETEPETEPETQPPETEPEFTPVKPFYQYPERIVICGGCIVAICLGMYLKLRTPRKKK